MTCVDLLFNPQVVWFERQQIPHSDDNRMEDGILIPVIWVRSDDDAGGWIEIADHITAAATRWQQEVFTLRAAPTAATATRSRWPAATITQMAATSPQMLA